MTTLSPSLPDLRGREQEIRVAVTAELARVLCLDPTLIDCGRPFDDYGLDSIDAVVTLGAVSERIGLDLPPELFFLYPTVNRAIAALTETEHTSAPSSPAFWFPGGGILDQRDSFDFRAQLAPDLAFDVINVGNWRDWLRSRLGMADLAARALGQIEAASPHGPLIFVGHSQGGQLAYATALLAVAAGREVAQVVLLDTVSLHRELPMRGRIGHLISREATDWWRLGQDRAGFWLRAAFKAWKVGLVPEPMLLEAMGWFARSRLAGPSGIRIDRAIQRRLFGKYWAVWLKSKPQALRVPVTLLRTEDPGAEDHGWRKLCPNVSVVRIGGDHFSMFAEGNRERLRAALLKLLSVYVACGERR